MLRYSLFLLGVFLALPILAVIAVSLGLPITISGIGYLFGGTLAAAGLILFPWAGRNSVRLTVLGFLVIALVASVRLILARQDRTGRIDQPAVGAHARCGLVQQAVLRRDACRKYLRRQPPAQFRLAPPRTRAAAGRIHQHGVEHALRRLWIG